MTEELLDDPLVLEFEESAARVRECRPPTRTAIKQAQRDRLRELMREGYTTKLGACGATIWRANWFHTW